MVHLCLVCINAESIENHNCFVEAAGSCAQKHPVLTSVLQIRQNVDCLQLAQDLINAKACSEKPGVLKVGMLNGANRKLVGNHWFQSGARFAIDENLHRRSSSMARAALLLNFDIEPRPRRLHQLEATVRWHGGTIYDISGGVVSHMTDNKSVPPMVSIRKDIGSGSSHEPTPTGVKASAAPGAKPGPFLEEPARGKVETADAKDSKAQGSMFGCFGGGGGGAKRSSVKSSKVQPVTEEPEPKGGAGDKEPERIVRP